MEAFMEDAHTVAKKANRSVRRLCRLMKSHAGKEKQVKAFESFCRIFGALQAYGGASLVRGDLSAADVMQMRSELRHALAFYLKMHHHFAGMTERADKLRERRMIRENRKIWEMLKKQDPNKIDDCKPCEEH